MSPNTARWTVISLAILLLVYFEHVELVAKLDHVGMIVAGKAADLLVLDANPLDDIRNTRRISSVWVAGRRIQMPGTN